jgi:hypothetical protein
MIAKETGLKPTNLASWGLQRVTRSTMHAMMRASNVPFFAKSATPESTASA